MKVYWLLSLDAKSGKFPNTTGYAMTLVALYRHAVETESPLHARYGCGVLFICSIGVPEPRIG